MRSRAPPTSWCRREQKLPSVGGQTAARGFHRPPISAEPTPWFTPWLGRVLPAVEEIARRHAERTVFTRFIPPAKAEDMPGAWQRYFRRWAEMTLGHIDPHLLDLVPSLARLVPPALVI